MVSFPDTIEDLETAVNKAMATESVAARPGLRVDVDAYQAYLEDTDLSDAQKREMIEALWSIVVSFVELGFGVHPVQEACGKLTEIEAESPKQDGDRVYSKHGLNEEFGQAAGCRARVPARE